MDFDSVKDSRTLQEGAQSQKSTEEQSFMHVLHLFYRRAPCVHFSPNTCRIQNHVVTFPSPSDVSHMSRSGSFTPLLSNAPLSASGWSSPDTEPETMQRAGTRENAHRLSCWRPFLPFTICARDICYRPARLRLG